MPFNMQLWIIGQIAIDLILVGVLVWLIISRKQRGDAHSPLYEEELRKAEEILNQMREVTAELEVNLEEKRKLTKGLLGRLDETLNRAELRYKQLNDLFESTDSASIRDKVSIGKSEASRESIQALLAKGLTREDVARRLGISVGEIELLMKLGGRSREA